MSHRAVLELAATGAYGGGISEPGEKTETTADRRAGRSILMVAGLAAAAVLAVGLASPRPLVPTAVGQARGGRLGG